MLLTLCLLCPGCATTTPERTAVDVEDLRRMSTKVLGSSGLPFGTIFHAQGGLMKNDRPGKNSPWTERMLVNRINGAEVAKPYLINVDSRYFGIDLEASDNIQLIGYESGGYAGQPAGVAEHTDWIPGDTGFYFDETFTVIRQGRTGD